MRRRFWRAFAALAALACAFSGLSWLFLTGAHVPLLAPAHRWLLFNLPTLMPSLWNIVLPGQTLGGWAPLAVLLVQVFFTGGFYGVLVRVNTGQPVSLRSYTADAVHSFGRLLLWNMLWTAMTLALAGMGTAWPATATLLAVLLWLARFVFLFADAALVCEPDFRTALRNAAAALFAGFLPMLPLAVVLTVLTGAGLALTASAPPLAFAALTLLYVVACVWLLHMVTARYLYFSAWQERQDPVSLTASAGRNG
ncbi:MAG: hypothetical protein K6T31_01625 [Alicyclobacillus sp.]|nr:hypothetical protein [Alicyclobacillus sp.]